MSIAMVAVELWLGSMFVYSATSKFANFGASRLAVARYGVLSERWAGFAGQVLPFAEFSAGVLLLTAAAVDDRFAVLVGGSASGAMAASFAYGSLRVLTRAESGPVPCGCGGSSELVSPITVSRAATIACASGFVLAFSGASQPHAIGWPSAVIVGCAAIAPGVFAMRSRTATRTSPQGTITATTPASVDESARSEVVAVG